MPIFSVKCFLNVAQYYFFFQASSLGKPCDQIRRRQSLEGGCSLREQVFKGVFMPPETHTMYPFTPHLNGNTHPTLHDLLWCHLPWRNHLQHALWSAPTPVSKGHSQSGAPLRCCCVSSALHICNCCLLFTHHWTLSSLDAETIYLCIFSSE